METEKTTKRNGEPVKRIITSAVIIISATVMFLLRQMPLIVKEGSPYDLETGKKIFDLVFYIISVIGTFEMTRAFKDKLNFFEKAVVWVFAAGFMPVLAFFGIKAGLILVCTAAGLIIADFVFSYKDKTVESAGYALFTLFYPTAALSAAYFINHRLGFLVLLLLFVVSSFSDSGAYIIGSIVKGRKLCPEISPKKTISGAIGGLIGGMAGALVVWIFLKDHMGSIDSGVSLAIMLAAGLFGSVATQFGDLVESEMKRKLGIKDFGKIFIGHGGMLDRIDGFIFNAFFLTLFFSFIKIIL